jgi:hypothetical protein
MPPAEPSPGAWFVPPPRPNPAWRAPAHAGSPNWTYQPARTPAVPRKRGAAHRAAREGLMTVGVFFVATVTAVLIVAVGLVASVAIG